jgi:large subunit ribosomal protein L11
MGDIIPAEITIFTDSSFRFTLKSPPTSFLLKKAAGISKGSSVPQTTKVASVNRKQIQEIAEIKLPDLNTNDMSMAMKQIEGTARQMGITITE